MGSAIQENLNVKCEMCMGKNILIEQNIYKLEFSSKTIHLMETNRPASKAISSWKHVE